MRPFGFCLRKIICDRVKGRRKSFFFFFFCEREKETAVITVRLVRIVVDSAVEVPVALELFGDAKGIVGAAEVGRLVAIVARFHFRPHGPEPSPAGHFVGQNEPVRENTTFYAQHRRDDRIYFESRLTSLSSRCLPTWKFRVLLWAFRRRFPRAVRPVSSRPARRPRRIHELSMSTNAIRQARKRRRRRNKKKTHSPVRLRWRTTQSGEECDDPWPTGPATSSWGGPSCDHTCRATWGWWTRRWRLPERSDYCRSLHKREERKRMKKKRQRPPPDRAS